MATVSRCVVAIDGRRRKPGAALGQFAPLPRRRAVSVDPAMLERAEAALSRLSASFGPWMKEELESLFAARACIHAVGLNAETGERLNVQAHEVKSLAATFGFPVITHIAASLCILIEDPENRLAAPLFLVDAHVDAIAAAMRAGLREVDHPVSRAVLQELQARVREAIQIAPTQCFT